MKKELMQGIVLQHPDSTKIAVEYALTVGRIEGLSMLTSIINEKPEEKEEDEERE
jgi:hypothetical protein